MKTHGIYDEQSPRCKQAQREGARAVLRAYGEHRWQLGHGEGIIHERNRRLCQLTRQACAALDGKPEAENLGEPGVYGD